MRDGVNCYIGTGVVVDPTHLLSEIERQLEHAVTGHYSAYNRHPMP